jgi:hypothetical protein
MKRVSSEEAKNETLLKKQKKYLLVPFTGKNRLEYAIEEALLLEESDTICCKPILLEYKKLGGDPDFFLAYWPKDKQIGVKFLSYLEDDTYDETSLDLLFNINASLKGNEDVEFLTQSCKPFKIGHFTELGHFRNVINEGEEDSFVKMSELDPRLYSICLLDSRY